MSVCERWYGWKREGRGRWEVWTFGLKVVCKGSVVSVGIS